MARMTKTDLKQVEYVKAMAAQPKRAKALPRWVRWSWDVENGCARCQWTPGAFRRRGLDWHREGSIDEIEAKENVGQRDLFS